MIFKSVTTNKISKDRVFGYVDEAVVFVIQSHTGCE